MKILQVITLADLGGAQSVLINICRELVEAKHNVLVVSEIEGPMWDCLDDRIEKQTIPSLQRAISPIADYKTLIALRKIYRTYRPDVIHLHSSKIGLLGRLAFPSQRIVYTVHGFDSIRLAFRKFLALERILQTCCRYIVGVSKYDVEGMQREGIDKNVVCIYNGVVDYSKYNNYDEANIKSAILEVKSKSTFTVLSVARLAKPKRFDLFCEVAARMEPDGASFIWIGNTYLPENLPSNVYCMGSCKDAYQYMQFSDLTVLISDYEGLPISIIETLLYGKPVVASAVGGISEILDGSNGFAVDNDVDTFEERIKYFMNNKNAYDHACHQARITYESKFTVSKMSAAYMALYNNILKENS